ncbi:MAG: hypothetical protein J3Q66DRAFT_5103 [Benniella sp.]|nr:MAG: hypothetical protein J3Q66DRAFT_5103 [Benniella sp.]
MLIPLPYFYLMCSGMCAQTQQPLVRLPLPNAYLLYLASVSCLMMVSSSPAPEPEPQGQAAPLPNSYLSPVAVLAAEPSTSGQSRPTIPTNFLPTTHNPVVTTTNILGTVTSTQFVTIIEPTTVITPTATTFSLSTTVDPIISVESRPSETPYGTIKDHSSNGGTMLIVSLAVVFAVLAGMVLVAVCLFCRRRQQLKATGKGSNSVMTSTGALGDILAVQRKDSSTGGFTISGGTDSNRQSLIIEPSRVMTEQHYNELLVRRSTESGRYSQSTRPNSRMLSPTLAPARPNGYWGGPHAGVRSGSTDTSTVYSTNECISGSLESPHDEYNRATYTPPYLPYAGANGGSSAYSSDEQLLSSRYPSRRPSLSPGLPPQSEVNQSPGPIVMSSSLANQADVHRLERPQSMLPLGPPPNLVIPPSITTRPRSMMSPNGVYISQSQGQGPFPYPPPPRPRYQSYNLNSSSQEPTTAYTHTAQSPVGADASTESRGPAGP